MYASECRSRCVLGGGATNNGSTVLAECAAPFTVGNRERKNELTTVGREEGRDRNSRETKIAWKEIRCRSTESESELTEVGRKAVGRKRAWKEKRSKSKEVAAALCEKIR